MAGALSAAEREQIAVGLVQGLSEREIGRRLNRAHSTVSREISRNSLYRHGQRFGRPEMRYEGHRAHAVTLSRRSRSGWGKLAKPSPLRDAVIDGLRHRHSPRQIAARLRRDHGDDKAMRVSHETIYQAIYVQARGNLRAELAHQVALRTGRARRRPRAQAAAAIRSKRPWLGLNISARPAEVEDRAVPGHWEGDLIVGAGNRSAVATLVERATRFLIMVALPGGKVSEYVASQLAEAMKDLPAQLLGSLTWDQGSEMASHPDFSIITQCPVYFCDPRSPWQRGTNENTNGLIRQYLPKSTDLRPYTQADLDTIAHEMNGRPRETLGWDTPAERLAKLLTTSSGATTS